MRGVCVTRNSATILEGVNLTVERGTVLQLVGPSGSGKTSLIRLVNRLDESTTGTIDVLGRSIRDWAPCELRQRVSIVFQEPTLLGLSVRENLRLPMEFAGAGSEDGYEFRMERALKLAGLEADWMERDESELSVGQKQRVSLARSLMTEPDVLLLDEPTSGLDPRSAESLLDRLRGVHEESGLTMIIVTHRLDEVRRLGGRMAVMISGGVAAEGEVSELTDNPPAGPIRDFLVGVETDG